MGKSFGSLNRSAPPPARQQAAPAQGAQSAAAAGGRGGLMGPIAGLAAGLGIAALASAMGFGEELANLITILLIVVAGVFVVRLIASRLAPRSPTPATATAGAGAGGGSAMAREATQAFGSAPGPGAAVSGSASAPVRADVPEGFDVDGFLRQAKVQFVRLQAVYDAGDLSDLREFTTPEMFAELKLEINERRGAANQTDVVTLDAELLGVRSEADEHLAAVRFTGRIRESENAPAEPFDEVWTLTKSVAGGGWVLAGIEQSH